MRFIKKVLEALREQKLYAKTSKCKFFQRKIQYLGHIISEEGIDVDLEKVEAIMNWPTPWNMTDVRYFIGLGGY